MDEMTDGIYGSFATRHNNRQRWTCYDSSDYRFIGVVDDFGNIVQVPGTLVKLRPY